MYSLLIVDDKEIFCRSILRMDYFKDPGSRFCVAHTARSGAEALEYLRQTPTDAVITDIRMPLMSGIELLKDIQSEGLCRCTILLSEFQAFSYAKEGLINGAFDYLVKPIDDAALRRTMDRAAAYLQRVHPAPDAVDALYARLAGDGGPPSREELGGAFAAARAGPQAEGADPLEAALRRLRERITVELPCAPLYLPLDRLCTRARWPEGEEEARFADMALRLYRALQKFRLRSSHALVRNVWQYTLRHIDEPCKLQAVAERFYINKNYLSTLFKKETGFYYKDFVLTFKVERAKLLLGSPGLKVWAVAEKLHFCDADYFGKVFKAKTGMIPSEFSFERQQEEVWTREK